jgi:hypothetical protein
VAGRTPATSLKGENCANPKCKIPSTLIGPIALENAIHFEQTFEGVQFESYLIRCPTLKCACGSEMYVLGTVPDIEILSVMHEKDLFHFPRIQIRPGTREISGQIRNNNQQKTIIARVVLGLWQLQQVDAASPPVDVKIGTAKSEPMELDPERVTQWTVEVEDVNSVTVLPLEIESEK